MSAELSSGEAMVTARHLSLGRAGLPACALLAVLAFIVSLSIGPVVIPFQRVLEVLWQTLSGSAIAGATREAIIVLDVRLPRSVLGFLVGGAIASAGAVMQGIFRNPLADPALVGISNGAALAAVMWIVLGASAAALPAACRQRLRPADHGLSGRACWRPGCCTSSPPTRAAPRWRPCCSPASR